MNRARRLLWGFASAWLLVAAGLVHANGGGLHATFFSSWWGSNKVPLKATVEYDPALMWSTTVEGKYRLFRVVLESAEGALPVEFAKDADTFEVTLPDRKVVKGILDLTSTLSPATWDALPPDVRKALVYPTELKGSSARAVYVLVPMKELVSEPMWFTYVIRSQPQPLSIRQKPASKA